MSRYLVCMTGASGAVYGLRLLKALSKMGVELHLVASEWGERLVLEETGKPLASWLEAMGPVTRHEARDLAAPVSSGSFRLDGTVIVPCSAATIGALASGGVANLVHRAGAVALKEGRPLVLVPRESPLSLITLRALVTLKEAGAVILPASPGFYTRPSTIDELVDQIVHRILDRLGLPDPSAPRWKDEGED
jgi:4-hydroxy-3-polyprenylbenzoate decarboxylase